MTDEPHAPRPEDNRGLHPDSGDGGGAPNGRFPVERAVAAVALLVICAISAANVVVRYATDASFAFTEEYSVMLLVVLTFAGTAAAARTDGHIRILAFANLFGRTVRRAMLVVSTFATVLMFLLVLGYGARLAYEQHRFGDVTAGLGNPAWIYSMAIPVLCVPILIRVVRAAVAKWREGRP